MALRAFSTAGSDKLNQCWRKIDAQHPLQTDRRATVAGLRINRFDQPTQATPRHHLLHLR